MTRAKSHLLTDLIHMRIMRCIINEIDYRTESPFCQKKHMQYLIDMNKKKQVICKLCKQDISIGQSYVAHRSFTYFHETCLENSRI